MAENSSTMPDTPTLLKMLAANGTAPGIDPDLTNSLKAKLRPQATQPQPAPGPALTTPEGPLDPSPYTTLVSMGAQVPKITPEEKQLQEQLLSGTQAQNSRLEGDVENQRLLSKIRNYMITNPQQDISPAVANLMNIAGQNSAAAVAAAKPDSPDTLTDKLQSALKETAGAQDKLSDNELNLLKMRLQFANTKGTAGAAQKQQQIIANYYQKLAKESDPSQASSRNGVGNPYKGLLAIDKVHGILDSVPDYNQLTSQQAAEVYEALAQVVANGSPSSEARIQSLVPGNAARKFSDIKQWITSNPQGANQQKFMENASHMLDREKEVLTNNVRAAQVRSFQGAAPFFATDPNGYLLFNKLREARGLRPDLTYDTGTTLTGYERKAKGGEKPAMSFEDFKKLKAAGKLP